MTNLCTLHHRTSTPAPLHHCMPRMTTRRRAGRGAMTTVDDTDTDQGRQPIQPKPKKPTVAQNAQAIETLAQKITDVDAQLTTMNSLLAQLAANKNTETTNIASTTPSVNPVHVANTPSQYNLQTSVSAPQNTLQTLQPQGVPPHCTPRGQHFNTSDYGAAAPTPTPNPTQTAYGQPAMTNAALYSAGGAVNFRACHHTTPATQPPYPVAPGWPSTAPAVAFGGMAMNGSHHHTLTANTHTAPANPWDHPTTLHDLESDVTLTRWVAEALTAVATPFSAITGKHAQFAHHLVTRGGQKAKDQPGGAIYGGIYMGVSSAD